MDRKKGREAALAWVSLAQRFPASSVLAREGAGCGSVGSLWFLSWVSQDSELCLCSAQNVLPTSSFFPSVVLALSWILSSRAEGLLFLHGLESNPGSSLQTEEEAGLP